MPIEELILRVTVILLAGSTIWLTVLCISNYCPNLCKCNRLAEQIEPEVKIYIHDT